MRKLPFALPLTSALLLLGCPHTVLLPSAGRDEMLALEAQARAVLLTDPAANWDRIGHRGGDLVGYAKNINSESLEPSRTRAVSEIMDNAFDPESGLTGIEIDLQTPFTAGDQRVVIVHDAVEWDALSPAALGYAEKNGLIDVVRHFVASGQFRASHLFLELKLEGWKEGSGDNEIRARNLAERSLASIESALAEFPDDEAAVRRQVAFVSLYTEALTALHAAAALRPGAESHRLIHIASTNTQLCQGSRLIGSTTPCHTEATERFLAETPWLSGVWYSPTFLVDAVQILNDIQRVRAAGTGLPPLTIHVAAYLSTPEGLIEALKLRDSEGKRIAQVQGLIFDLSPPE